MVQKISHYFNRYLVVITRLLLVLAIANVIDFAPAINAQTAQTAPDASHQLYLPFLTNGVLPAEPAPAAKLSTPQLIKQAFLRGEITADQQALYLAYALYEPQSLPPQFRSNVGWYGTQYVLEVQKYMQSVSSASTDAVQKELGRLETLASTVCDKEDGANSTNSTNFHFNYGTIGGGLTIANYQTSMEATFNTEVTQFGWAKPPLCTGGDTCGGNTNSFGRYPIQVFALGNGLYGYVTTGGGLYTGFVGDNPNTSATETDAIASCMVLNDNFSQFPEGAQGALDSTTSHEFVHAIQNGYGDPDPREDAMWYESSAAYMEDEVFNNANSDYQYLWPVVSNALGKWPNNDEPGGVSQYSNFLFFRYVAEHNGGAHVVNGGENVMQHFWEHVGAGQAALTAYNNALVTAGTNLPDTFHKYAIAAKFEKGCTGGYAGLYCLEEGPDYTSFVGSLPPAQGSIAANPGSYNGSIQNYYAVNWVSLPTSGSPYQVTLHNTAAGGQLRGSLVCDTGSALTVVPFPSVVGAGASTAVSSFNASGCTSVVAVITNQEQLSLSPITLTADSYTLSVSAATSTPTATNTPVTPSATPTDTPTNTPVTPTPTATDTSTSTPVTPTPTPTDTSTSTPVTPTPTPTDTSTSTPVTPTATPTDTSTSTPVTPTPTPTDTSTSTPVTPTATPTDTSTSTPVTPTAIPTNTATATATPTASNAVIFLTVGQSGGLNGLKFKREDILTYDMATKQWSKFFKGANVGLTGVPIEGFVLLPNGHLLLSFGKKVTLNGLGKVSPYDIVEFTPTALGANTAGSFAWYFRGGQVGLTKDGETIDAFAVTADHNLLISTNGSVDVPGVSGGKDEDILLFHPTSLGAQTAGSWSLYFKGAKVGLTNGDEDLSGVAVDPNGGANLYLSTKGPFSVQSNNSLSGHKSDIFVCTATALGANPTCTFSLFFDGEANGLRKDIDAIFIAQPTSNVLNAVHQAATNGEETDIAETPNNSDANATAITAILNSGDSELDIYDLPDRSDVSILYMPFVRR